MLSQSSHTWIEKDANFFHDDIDDDDDDADFNVCHVWGVWGICHGNGNGSGIRNEHRTKGYAAHASDNITAIFKASIQTDAVHTANWHNIQESQ